MHQLLPTQLFCAIWRLPDRALENLLYTNIFGFAYTCFWSIKSSHFVAYTWLLVWILIYVKIFCVADPHLLRWNIYMPVVTHGHETSRYGMMDWNGTERNDTGEPTYVQSWSWFRETVFAIRSSLSTLPWESSRFDASAGHEKARTSPTYRTEQIRSRSASRRQRVDVAVFLGEE